MKFAAVIGAVIVLAVAAPAASSNGARISIPRIGLSAPIGQDLNDGPMWWPHTGRPGRGTTVAIAGHRTTYTRPFNGLNRLQIGDKIRVLYGGSTFQYRVKKVYVRSAKDLLIAYPTDYERLILTACSNPDGTPTSLSYRIVVWAKRV